MKRNILVGNFLMKKALSNTLTMSGIKNKRERFNRHLLPTESETVAYKAVWLFIFSLVEVKMITNEMTQLLDELQELCQLHWLGIGRSL